MKNTMLEKTKAGKKTIGTFTHMASANAVTCLGYTGLDYVIVDTEHNAVDSHNAAGYIAAALAAGITPFVRVNEISRTAVLRMLDAGAQGLIVPCVKSLDEIQLLIKHAKFAPKGERGFCPSADGAWGFAPCMTGSIEDYMETANRETLLIPQCETLECLENVEAIAEKDGVDGIFLGPFDLSIAMGIPGRFEDEKMQKAISRVQEACKNAGKISIIFTGSEEKAKEYLEKGYDSVTVGLDNTVYVNAYRQIVQKIKK